MGTSTRLTDRTCREFAADLSARTPVPGGGGAAAYAGALAAALCSMVGAYTVGKPRYAEHEDAVRRMLAEAEDLRADLLGLVERDAEAYSLVSRAYAIPREDPSRADVVEGALRCAAEPPLATMEACARAIALLEEMGEKGSRMLLSDVGVGAALAGAALRAASLNVFVNTAAMRDRARAAELESACDGLLCEWGPRAEVLLGSVSAAVRKEA